VYRKQTLKSAVCRVMVDQQTLEPHGYIVGTINCHKHQLDENIIVEFIIEIKFYFKTN